MLPSRGVVRSSQALCLHMTPPCRPPSVRRGFGTAGLSRRTPRAPTAAASSSSPSRISIGLLSGRRAGLSGMGPAVRRHNLPAASAAFSLSSLNPASWWSKTPPASDAATTTAASGPLDAARSEAASTLPPPPEPSSLPVDAVVSPAADPAASAVSEILDGSALLDMPEQIGYLHALGLDFGWGPTSLCQWALEHVHIYTGLPWWASIVAVTLLFRGAILLPSLTAAEQSAKFQVLRQDPKFIEITNELKESMTMSGNESTRTRAMELRVNMQRMQRAAGIQQWKMFIPMVNVPFGFGMFRLLRAMCALPVPGMESAGLAWFMDLTAPDPYFLLPIISAGTMYLIFKSNLKYMAPEQQQMMKMVQIVITPVSLLVTANMSSSLTFFFAIGSMVQAFQTWLWHQPWLRIWAGMPPLNQLTNGSSSAGRAATAAFRLAPGSTWQAPRTIAPAASAKSDGVPSTVEVIKKGWDKAVGTAKDKQGASGKKQTLSEAQDYEKKRALQEEENLYRRREAERQYREMRRSIARAERQKQKN